MVVAVNFEKGTVCISPILSAFMGQSLRALTFIIFLFSSIILWPPLALLCVNSIPSLFHLRPLLVAPQEWEELFSFGREKEPADCFTLESFSLRESREASPTSAEPGVDVSHRNHVGLLPIKGNRASISFKTKASELSHLTLSIKLSLQPLDQSPCKCPQVTIPLSSVCTCFLTMVWLHDLSPQFSDGPKKCHSFLFSWRKNRVKTAKFLSC